MRQFFDQRSNNESRFTMPDDNPYAAPQAALDHTSEPLVIHGEMPYLADVFAFQRGAERASSALGFVIALLIGTIFFGFIGSSFRNLLFPGLVAIVVVAISQLLCWRYFTGLSQMRGAARLELQTWLQRARWAFLLAWSCYAIKLFVMFFFLYRAETLLYACEVLDNAAAATMAFCVGLAALRLGRVMYLSALRRVAWMTMIFLGGSHLVFGITDAAWICERVSPFVGRGGDTLLMMVVIAALGFVIGYFSLMGLLSQLSRLPLWQSSQEETILDSATIERRRQMTEGQS